MLRVTYDVGADVTNALPLVRTYCGWPGSPGHWRDGHVMGHTRLRRTEQPHSGDPHTGWAQNGCPGWTRPVSRRSFNLTITCLDKRRPPPRSPTQTPPFRPGPVVPAMLRASRGDLTPTCVTRSCAEGQPHVAPAVATAAPHPPPPLAAHATRKHAQWASALVRQPSMLIRTRPSAPQDSRPCSPRPRAPQEMSACSATA